MKWRIPVGIFAIGLACQMATAQNSVGNFLTGDAKLEVLHRYSGPRILSKPKRVVIEDFAAVGSVVMDPHHHLLALGSNQAPTPEDLMQQVRDSFADTLVKQFKRVNMDAYRVHDASGTVGPALVIQGQFVALDAGSARKRILVGFGHGASHIKAHVIISMVENRKKTVLLDCSINAESSKKPGAILSTSAAGFGVGVLLGHFGDRSSTVQADTSRMAKLVGKQIEAAMVAQK